MVLLDYLGVCPDLRGRGLGSACLKKLLEYCRGQTILVEAEAEISGLPDGERALRRRRLEFYRRAGFVPLPWCSRIFGVDYAVLAGGGVPAPEEAMAAYARLYRSEFPPAVYRRKVLIRPLEPEMDCLAAKP